MPRKTNSKATQKSGSEVSSNTREDESSETTHFYKTYSFDLNKPLDKQRKWDTRKKYRNWMYTEYDTDYEFECDDITFEVYQLEMCPTTGRQHAQGYLELKGQKTLKQMKTISATARFEPRYFTQEAAIKYCTKQETRIAEPVFKGDPKNQGERNDLTTIKNMIDDGKSMEDIACENFGSFIRYNKGIEKYASLRRKNRHQAPRVTLICGKSGISKTSSIRLIHGHDNVYSKRPNQWWQKYDGQKALVFDEAKFDQYDKHFWCTVLSEEPIPDLEVKGGDASLNSPFIYIINSDVHKLNEFCVGDLRRRIDDRLYYVEEHEFENFKVPEDPVEYDSDNNVKDSIKLPPWTLVKCKNIKDRNPIIKEERAIALDLTTLKWNDPEDIDIDPTENEYIQDVPEGLEIPDEEIPDEIPEREDNVYTADEPDDMQKSFEEFLAFKNFMKNKK